MGMRWKWPASAVRVRRERGKTGLTKPGGGLPYSPLSGTCQVLRDRVNTPRDEANRREHGTSRARARNEHRTSAMAGPERARWALGGAGRPHSLSSTRARQARRRGERGRPRGSVSSSGSVEGQLVDPPESGVLHRQRDRRGEPGRGRIGGEGPRSPDRTGPGRARMCQRVGKADQQVQAGRIWRPGGASLCCRRRQSSASDSSSALRCIYLDDRSGNERLAEDTSATRGGRRGRGIRGGSRSRHPHGPAAHAGCRARRTRSCTSARAGPIPRGGVRARRRRRRR
jgi:hypothetical protein